MHVLVAYHCSRDAGKTTVVIENRIDCMREVCKMYSLAEAAMRIHSAH